MTDKNFTLEYKKEHHHIDSQKWLGDAISICINAEEIELILYHPHSDQRFRLSFDFPYPRIEKKAYADSINHELERLSKFEDIFLSFFDEAKARLEYALLKGPSE